MAANDQRARSANIFDVARLAGVSHQTVSRVLNDLPNVRASTRDRVEEAIKQLRYVPSPAARALVTRRSRVVGLITTGGPDYGKSMTALHFGSTAREARYSVSTVSMLEADDAALRAATEMLLRQNVEAIVLIATSIDVVQALDRMEIGAPIITVASGRDEGFGSVSVDQYRGAHAITTHLIELGHRDIRHVAGPSDSWDALERIRGWKGAMTERRLPTREPLVGDWSPRGGFEAAKEFEGDEPTAVFASNDQMAMGVIHGLRTQGLVVPDDVSVAGFDDIPEAEHANPALTTVRQDFRTLGRDAFAAVIAAIDDDTDRLRALRHLPELIVRESTGIVTSAALARSDRP
jgi:DNA-binding LacI/PurR family transcriptional regulator